MGLKKYKVVVSVSDKYLWALKPFMHLFNKYWIDDEGLPDSVEIAGYTRPNFPLLSNFSFVSITEPMLPKERWADGIIHYLNAITDDYIVFLLEDYWLCRKVNLRGIESLCEMMATDDRILRIDLTADRQTAGGSYLSGYYGEFDIIEAPKSQYQMSLQAGLWNRKNLLNILNHLPVDARSAWDVELVGTEYVNVSSYIVYGTRQWPVWYINGMNNAENDKINLVGLTQEDYFNVKQMINESGERVIP